MFLLLDKPCGYTSFDMIRKLKRLYPGEKIWHAGTLDPLATWLLLIAIGKDTKKIKHFVWLDKTYTAVIDFSQYSDTWDTDFWQWHEVWSMENNIWTMQKRTIKDSSKDMQREAISSKDAYIPKQDDIEQALQNIVWRNDLPLTPFSAKKWKGKKLYEYAREWSPVQIDIQMQLLDFSIISYAFPLLEISFHVWSGTYIRSLAHRLGKQFGLGGVLTALHREKVGEYTLDV